MNEQLIQKPKIGLALGSGSARGWAHIGVIQELADMGGAVVGAAYTSNQLDKLENWVRTLTWKEILKYIDLTITGGGLIQGNKLFELAKENFKEDNIESLPRQFGMVATELDTGWWQQNWIRDEKSGFKTVHS